VICFRKCQGDDEELIVPGFNINRASLGQAKGVAVRIAFYNNNTVTALPGGILVNFDQLCRYNTHDKASIGC